MTQERQPNTKRLTITKTQIAYFFSFMLTAGVVANYTFRDPRLLKNVWEIMRSVNYLNTAKNSLDYIRTSNHSGQIGAALLGPATAFTLNFWGTMPRQQRLEAERMQMQRQAERERASEQDLKMELENAYNNGLASLQRIPKKDIKPNYPRAAESFKKARRLLVQLYPTDTRPEFKEKLRTCMFNEAIALFYIGKFTGSTDNALDILNDLLRGNPEDREALNVRGLIYLKIEKHNEAMRDFANSLKVQISQNDIYVCWLYTKSMCGKDTSLFESILDHIQIPSQESIITNEILFIYANISYESGLLCDSSRAPEKVKDLLARAIAAAEAAIDVTPKNPGFYQEQIKLLNLIVLASLYLSKVITDSKPVEIKPLSSNRKQYNLDAATVKTKHFDVQQKIAGLHNELKLLQDLTNIIPNAAPSDSSSSQRNRPA